MILRWIYKYRRRIDVPTVRTFKRKLNILGIESSCDDTGAAVINESKEILGEGHYSQVKIHAQCGGIMPNVASTLHKTHLQYVVDESMRSSQLDFADLDAIAITVKPGLILSLATGVEFAKNLCKHHNKPLLPIHHMEAHALTIRLIEEVKFPYVVFLVSGGHCILALVKSPTEFYKLGESTDMSPGQVLDKVARRAKLSYQKEFRGMSGGAAIEKAALKGKTFNIEDDRFQFYAMTNKRNCNFSFSAMVTVALNHIVQQEKLFELEPDAVIPDISDLCASIQWAIARHLCQRLELALLYIEKKELLEESEKCLVLSGGVASNNFIRSALAYVCQEYNYRFKVPPAKFCTDNGVMIAWNGIERLRFNCPLVEPSNLDSVQPQAKCELGEDLSEDVDSTIKVSSIKNKVRLLKFIKEYEVNKLSNNAS